MKNNYFERHTEDYSDSIMGIQPDFYKNSGFIIDKYLCTGAEVIDIGNGGVINYDLSKLDRLVCADIALPDSQKYAKYFGNEKIELIIADISKMTNVASNRFDVVIVQTVIHHLARSSYKKTKDNVLRALNECMRIVKPGGKVIIVESTVTRWFENIEKGLYGLMQIFFKICRFGFVFQFSKESLNAIIINENIANIIESGKVDVGSHIWIMGLRIPKCITPCGAHFWILEKK